MFLLNFKTSLFYFFFRVQFYMSYMYSIGTVSCFPVFIYLFTNRAVICSELQCV